MSNILVVSSYWPTKSNTISGIFVVQQVSALANLGCKVTVLLSITAGRASEPFLSAHELGLPKDKVKLEFVKIIRLPEFMSASVTALKVSARLSGFCYSVKIKKLAVSIGPFCGCIVHGTRYAFLGLPRWRKYISNKVVSVVHGVDPLFEKIYKKRGCNYILQNGAEASDYVVLVGRPLKPYVTKLGVPIEKQKIIANGADIPDLDKLGSCSLKKSSSVKVISVSNLIRLKGIDHNLEALSMLCERRPDLNFEYLVVGDGPERKNLEILSAELGIESRVSFVGRIEHKLTMEKIEEADIFSLPSWGEAFGIVYLEAMARNKPVIGCYDNGAEDIFEHGKQGYLIEPMAVKALADFMEILIANDDIRNKMGQEGRLLAESYTWESNARKFLDLL